MITVNQSVSCDCRTHRMYRIRWNCCCPDAAHVSLASHRWSVLRYRGGVYTGWSRKIVAKLLFITASNIDRFSKFCHSL